MEPLKIAIIGDYNFTFNAHHATNLSLDHASIFLDVEINYYWIKISDAAQQNQLTFPNMMLFGLHLALIKIRFFKWDI